MGRVARGQANPGVDAIEDATFEATVKQTVADMKTELNNVVRASAVAMSNYNRLDAEYQKYVRQAQDWKDRAGHGARRRQRRPGQEGAGQEGRMRPPGGFHAAVGRCRRRPPARS